MSTSRCLAGWAGLTCSAITFGTPAIAQDRAGANSTIQEVIVTGSRLRRDPGFDSPVPVATIDGEALRGSGFTVLGDALSNLPQALVNSSVQNTSGTLFNAGQSRVDLRALGAARTLVLVDGRRHLTGDFRTSAVDLNMIPSTMIERIDAISGGSSAVYGSEAIAGVVNIILRNRMDGFDADVQGGMTGENDGAEWKAALGWGTSFADGRGSVLVGAEMGKVEPIYQVDRDWAYPGIRRNTLVTPQTIVPQSRSNTTPTATFQFVNSNDPAAARSSSIGLDRGAVFSNTTECRTATVRPLCQDPWLFYGAQYNALQGTFERETARAYVDFAFTDNVKVFADVSYGRGDGKALFQPAFSNAAGGGTMPIAMRGDNAYLNGSTPLAVQLRTQWLDAKRALTRSEQVNVGKFWSEFGNRDSRVFRESYRSVAGLQGDFELLNRKFEWDTYAQYSKLEGYTAGYNVPNVLKTQQAVDAVLVNGQIVCQDAAARAAGCAPWDLINGPSPQAIAWANADTRADGTASQTVVAANISTSLYELPAGSLGFAVGAEYREEKSDQTQDALTASGALFYNALGQTKGEYDTTEFYTELVVPILRDLPFAHRLSVEAAGRIGDYSTVGNIEQWRLQSTWAPVSDVSFRASKSTAVRAPNITELFGPQGRNFTQTANDPCDRGQIANAPSRATRVANCAAVIPGYDPATFVSNFGSGRSSLSLLQGGNPDLSEEQANTESVGVVIKPRWVQNLTLSLDYWKIEVEDAINLIPINTLLTNLCYDAASAPTSNRFCDLVRRDPTGALTGVVGGVSEVILTQQNVQSIETSGVDLAFQYSQDFGAPGLLQLRLDGTKVIRWDLQGSPGQAITHFGGTLPGAVPNYKAAGTVGWVVGPVSVQWQSRFQSSYAVSEVDPSTSRDPFYTGDYWEHDLRGSFKINDALAIRGGVINLTNEHPPYLPESFAGTSATSSTFDNRGRWYYVGASYSFKPAASR